MRRHDVGVILLGIVVVCAMVVVMMCGGCGETIRRGLELREFPVQYAPVVTEHGVQHDVSQQVRGDMELSIGLLEVAESSRFTYIPTAGDPLLKMGVQVGLTLARSYLVGVSVEARVGEDSWVRVCGWYGLINQPQRLCREYDDFAETTIGGSTE